MKPAQPGRPLLLTRRMSMQPVLASLSAVDMTESRSTMSSQPPEHSDPIAKSFEMSWQFRTVTFRVDTPPMANCHPFHVF